MGDPNAVCLTLYQVAFSPTSLIFRPEEERVRDLISNSGVQRNDGFVDDTSECLILKFLDSPIFFFVTCIFSYVVYQATILLIIED
jgi:hypothetical protein